MTKKMTRILVAFCLTGLMGGCSSRSGGGTAAAPSPPATPTPPGLKRLNPNIVSETDTEFVERFSKREYFKVDDHHIRSPLMPMSVEYFKEDDDYYYVMTPKRLPEELTLRKREAEKLRESAALQPTPAAPGGPEPPLTAADFTDISPDRVRARFHLTEVTDSGLPQAGMWRASFVVADMNGDGIPDIVSPPPRVGGSRPLIWLGDGHGKFRQWPLTFTVGGKPAASFGINYGGIAVGDIDGDGHQDMVSASHGGGLLSLFGNGRGNFEVVGEGLARRDFSSQAVILLDADGDGKLDIVASRDMVPSEAGPVDKAQVRVYLYRSPRRWEFKSDGLVGGFYSLSLHARDFDGDGRADVLTGSHYSGALSLLWRNEGDGTFSRVSFPEIEKYALHFASAPGTFGRERVPAFADAYTVNASIPDPINAEGISVYSFSGGNWSRHRVWRHTRGLSFQYALAMGDLDGDGLDDIVFPDSVEKRLRIFLQQKDGSFREIEKAQEPILDSPGQCVQLADLNGDGRKDIVLSKTVASTDSSVPGGWSVYLNEP